MSNIPWCICTTASLSIRLLITSPGWMHETSARTWCTGKTWRERVEREVGGGIGMGNTCKPKAVSFQCMTKFTTNKKKTKEKKKQWLSDTLAITPIYSQCLLTEVVRGIHPVGEPLRHVWSVITQLFPCGLRTPHLPATRLCEHHQHQPPQYCAQCSSK